MSRIRLDLVGAVWVDGVALLAGDEVPEGAVVGEHVVEPKGETEAVEVVETV
ncbi:hypothetical protein M2390_003250, partial [Mycetocola sp. BIGb0189]|nr:hypothetical protein [Mycetocola sp. BIGb0189]